MEKLNKTFTLKILNTILGVLIVVNFALIGWLPALYPTIKITKEWLDISYLSFYVILLVCFGAIIDPFIAKYLPFLTKNRLQVNEQQETPKNKKGNTEVWLLLFCFTTFFSSCILLKQTPYTDVARTLTERKLKQMYNVDVSFGQDSINLQKDFQYSYLQNIFSNNVLREFTGKGHVDIENLNFKTNVFWQYYEKEFIPMVFIKYHYHKKQRIKSNVQKE